MGTLGLLDADEGREAEAVARLSEEIRICQEVGSAAGAGLFEAELGRLQARQGSLTVGLGSLNRSITALDASASLLESGRARCFRAAVRAQLGDREGAGADLEAARALLDRLGSETTALAEAITRCETVVGIG